MGLSPTARRHGQTAPPAEDVSPSGEEPSAGESADEDLTGGQGVEATETPIHETDPCSLVTLAEWARRLELGEDPLRDRHEIARCNRLLGLVHEHHDLCAVLVRDEVHLLLRGVAGAAFGGLADPLHR